MRKICFITGTRAEYGLLNRLMRMINEDTSSELQIIATNMHLSPEFGMTYREIEEDGFIINKKIEMLLSADTPTSISKSLGIELIGIADAYHELAPDLIVILGDRYEMLGAAIAALFLKIPIVHISGGDITEGAYDDAIRHSITKMSHFHFVSTDIYRKRVIQLGESPDTVFNVGSLGIDNIRHTKLMTKGDLEKNINFPLSQRNVLVTYHPVTLDSEATEDQFASLLAALDEVECHIIFTKPNSDSNGRSLIAMIDEYVVRNKDRAISFISLGHLRYLSALQYMDVVIGNSSSGIVEVPSFNIPTINIGDRQKGRLQASSTLNCIPEKTAILDAINKAFSDEFKLIASNTQNPYEQTDTAKKIYTVIRDCSLEHIIQKKFFDLK